MVVIIGVSLSFHLIYIFCAFCAVIQILIGQALVSAAAFFQTAGFLLRQNTTTGTTNIKLHRTSAPPSPGWDKGISMGHRTCRIPSERDALSHGRADRTWTSSRLRSCRSCSGRIGGHYSRGYDVRDGRDNRGNHYSWGSSDTHSSKLTLLPSSLL